MKCLKRNKVLFYYALYEGTEHLTGEDGYRTGEPVAKYGDPVEMHANISPASGATRTEIFGNNEDYSKVIVTCEKDCPIDENSVLWVDRMPELDEEGKTDTPHDYVVKHVAKSLNSISYAIDKVNKRR